MKGRIIAILFLMLGIISHAQERNSFQTQNGDLKFTVLENDGPSLVYQVTSDTKTEIEVQIKNIDQQVVSSDKISVSDNYVSKINVYEVMKSEFFVVLLKNNKEIMRKKLVQTNK